MSIERLLLKAFNSELCGRLLEHRGRRKTMFVSYVYMYCLDTVSEFNTFTSSKATTRHTVGPEWRICPESWAHTSHSGQNFPILALVWRRAFSELTPGFPLWEPGFPEMGAWKRGFNSSSSGVPEWGGPKASSEHLPVLLKPRWIKPLPLYIVGIKHQTGYVKNCKLTTTL